MRPITLVVPIRRKPVTFTIPPALYSNIQYDAVKDFTTIGRATSNIALVVNASVLPAKTLHELEEIHRRNRHQGRLKTG